ncbi:MAG TPA: chromate transporter [Firmicutes bacterium]|nr:chromate transporter [Bacillota bacterium]
MLRALFDLAIACGRVGLLGYGGGPASIPLMEVEAVDNYGWVTTEEFINVLAMGNALPGPILPKMAGYIGFKVAGWAGAFVALGATILPTFFAMVLLFNVYWQFRDLPHVQGMIKAVRPLVIVLLGLLIYDMWPKAITSWQLALIGIVGLGLIKFANVHPAIVVVGTLVFGAFFLH